MSDDKAWFYAPAICAVVLTAGVIAGVLRALGKIRASEEIACGGIPLPKCHSYPAGFASPGMVQITAALALLTGFVGLVIAARLFVLGWYKAVPPYLFILTLGAYSLLLVAVLITGIGMKWKHNAEVYQTFQQSAVAALLGALAAGLGQWVLCDVGEPEKLVSRDWRQGCTMLGASSGLLLLGMVAAQWGNPSPKSPNSQVTAREPEEAPAAVSNGTSPRPQGDPACLHSQICPLLSHTLRPCLTGNLHEPLIPTHMPVPTTKENPNTSCFEARHNRTHSSSIFRSPLGANFPT